MLYLFMMGGKRICFSWAVVGREEKQIRVGYREHRLSATLIKSMTERLLWVGRGRLSALTVISNVRYKPNRTIMKGGKQILLFLGG